MHFETAEESISEVRGERGASIMCWSPTASEQLMKRVGEINLSYLWCLKEKTKCSGMTEGKALFGFRIVGNACSQCLPTCYWPPKRWEKLDCFSSFCSARRWVLTNNTNNSPLWCHKWQCYHTWPPSQLFIPRCEATCCFKIQQNICLKSFNRGSWDLRRLKTEG